MTTYRGRLVGGDLPYEPPTPQPIQIDPDLPILAETARQLLGARPMDVRDRLATYRRQTGGKVTGPQQRRANKKSRRQKRNPT